MTADKAAYLSQCNDILSAIANVGPNMHVCVCVYNLMFCAFKLTFRNVSTFRRFNSLPFLSVSELRIRCVCIGLRAGKKTIPPNTINHNIINAPPHFFITYNGLVVQKKISSQIFPWVLKTIFLSLAAISFIKITV